MRDEDVKVGLKYDIQWYNKVQILTSNPGETKMLYMVNQVLI